MRFRPLRTEPEPILYFKRCNARVTLKSYIGLLLKSYDWKVLKDNTPIGKMRWKQVALILKMAMNYKLHSNRYEEPMKIEFWGRYRYWIANQDNANSWNFCFITYKLYWKKCIYIHIYNFLWKKVAIQYNSLIVVVVFHHEIRPMWPVSVSIWKLTLTTILYKQNWDFHKDGIVPVIII
jgi:hypothetical protein